MKKIQVIIFRKQPSGVEFLLLKRNENTVIRQGVTGKVEDQDKNLLSAVSREISEELCHQVLEKNIYGPLFSFEFITDRTGHEGEKTTEYCYAYEAPADFEFQLSNEHTSFRWLKKEDTIDLINYDTSKKLVRIVCDKLI